MTWRAAALAETIREIVLADLRSGREAPRHVDVRPQSWLGLLGLRRLVEPHGIVTHFRWSRTLVGLTITVPFPRATRDVLEARERRFVPDPHRPSHLVVRSRDGLAARTAIACGDCGALLGVKGYTIRAGSHTQPTTGGRRSGLVELLLDCEGWVEIDDVALGDVACHTVRLSIDGKTPLWLRPSPHVQEPTAKEAPC